MGILGLPAELIHRIYLQCEPPDIRALRSVNKLSLTIANEYFLPDIRLFFLKDDYETAAKFVRNSEIAKGVRSLNLQADVFPEDIYYKR